MTLVPQQQHSLCPSLAGHGGRAGCGPAHGAAGDGCDCQGFWYGCARLSHPCWWEGCLQGAWGARWVLFPQGAAGETGLPSVGWQEGSHWVLLTPPLARELPHA